MKLLEINNLNIYYLKKGKRNSVINDFSLTINDKEFVALIGKSGVGKTTIAKTIIGFHNLYEGEIIYHTNKEDIQYIFQDPYSSLNPKLKIFDILKEPLDINTFYTNKEKQERIFEIISDVGLQESCLNLYPHEFSGGQRQRIAIARALILNPEFLIADEPVSALDASIQAQIINLMKELKQKRNLTILFISHDMNVIKYLADKVGIMYFGSLIEENYTSTLFKYPKEDYTKKLLNSVPTLKLM